MVVKINGKPFDFDATDLYEGETPERGQSLLSKLLWLAALGLLACAAYPFVVHGLLFFFKPLLHYFGIPY